MGGRHAALGVWRYTLAGNYIGNYIIYLFFLIKKKKLIFEIILKNIHNVYVILLLSSGLFPTNSKY